MAIGVTVHSMSNLAINQDYIRTYDLNFYSTSYILNINLANKYVNKLLIFCNLLRIVSYDAS